MKYNINLLRDKLLPASLSFITILLLSRYTVFSSTLKWGTWSYGENLISYPEKFLRRGLLGELILLISGENSAFNTIQVMVFLNCLLLLFLIYKLFKLYQLSMSQFNLFLLSSFGLLYMIYYGNSFNRKEIFAINFYLIFLYYFKKSDHKINNLFKINLFLSLIFILLIHEGLLFVTIPFYYLTLKEKYKRIANTYVLFGTIGIIIMLSFQGNEDDVLNMWNKINEFDQLLIGDLKSSAIYALAYSYEKQIFYQSGFDIILSGRLNHWLFILFYFFIYLFLNHFEGDFEKLNKAKSELFKKEMLYCLPLFIFGGADWGRYFLFFIYIYYFYLIFVFDLKKIEINSTASLKYLNIFVIYSFFTIIPEATYQDIDIIEKVRNSIDEILKLLS